MIVIAASVYHRTPAIRQASYPAVSRIRCDLRTDLTYSRWKVRTIGNCDLGGNNQYNPEAQMAESYTNILAAKTDTSSESICSASLSQTRERSRRAYRTHGNEDPKYCPDVSRNRHPFKGLRTPRLPSRPHMFDLKQTWSQQRAQDADGINSTSLVRQRQQIVIEQDRASGYCVVL